MNRAWLDAVRDELQTRARRYGKAEATITYGDLADRIGMPGFRNAAWQSHPLCDILGRLDEEDTETERPFISALVVNATTQFSGPGFFKALADLRRNGNPVPDNERYTYWSQEVDRVLAYYK
jgi:hypothetical protein